MSHSRFRKVTLRKRIRKFYNALYVTFSRGGLICFSAALTAKLNAQRGDIWTLEYDDNTHRIRMYPISVEESGKTYTVQLVAKGSGSRGLPRLGFTDAALFDKLRILRRTNVTLVDLSERDGKPVVEFQYAVVPKRDMSIETLTKRRDKEAVRKRIAWKKEQHAGS